LLIVSSTVLAQITVFPYSEGFDNTVAPNLPSGWSLNGFVDTSSTSRSSPNCILAKGNTVAKTLITPAFDFTNRVPDKLIFYEYRSNTAKYYRLEIRVSTDGIIFNTLLVQYDSITTLSSFVPRVVNLSGAGLQGQPNVQFQWKLLGDNLNNTGVLRIDDVSLSVAIGLDVGLEQMVVSPIDPTRKDSVVLSAVVKNYGLLLASNFSIRFFCDDNLNGIPEPSEQFAISDGLTLNSGDSLICTVTYSSVKAGEQRFIATIDFPSDENRTNDTGYAVVKVGNMTGDVLVNEIMYEPLDGQNEWLELLNRSSQPIDISQWTFNDKATSSGVNSFVITNKTSIVKSGEYMIVAADSSIFKLFPNLVQSDSDIHIVVLNRSGGFSFNNDGDAVVLKDLTGQTIDSVDYLPDWHHPDVVDTRGRSLERISPNIDSNDPRNWSTCTNLLGGTPGNVNSIFTTSTASETKISISPNPFSPDGDGFEDFCIIHYNLPMIISTLNVRIYDIKGRIVRILANGELAGNHSEIIWNGLDDNKQRVRIGVYVVFLEATDRASGRVETGKSVAVVATKL
jgi:hypothetical protein